MNPLLWFLEYLCFPSKITRITAGQRELYLYLKETAETMSLPSENSHVYNLSVDVVSAESLLDEKLSEFNQYDSQPESVEALSNEVSPDFAQIDAIFASIPDHQLEEIGGQKAVMRKRCVGCYRKISVIHGRNYASSHAKRVNTRCSKCLKHFCVECYHEFHKNCDKSYTMKPQKSDRISNIKGESELILHFPQIEDEGDSSLNNESDSYNFTNSLDTFNLFKSEFEENMDSRSE